MTFSNSHFFIQMVGLITQKLNGFLLASISFFNYYFNGFVQKSLFNPAVNEQTVFITPNLQKKT